MARRRKEVIRLDDSLAPPKQKGASTNRSACWKWVKLLGAEDRVLRGFGDAELHDALGRDLDGLSGLGVAAHAGGAVLSTSLPMPGSVKVSFACL